MLKDNRVRKIGKTQHHIYAPSAISYEHFDENGDEYYVRDHYTTPKERKTDRSNNRKNLMNKADRAAERVGWARGFDRKQQTTRSKKPVTKKPVHKVAVKKKVCKRCK
jgi:hypothetical protein